MSHATLALVCFVLFVFSVTPFTLGKQNEDCCKAGRDAALATGSNCQRVATNVASQSNNSEWCILEAQWCCLKTLQDYPCQNIGHIILQQTSMRELVDRLTKQDNNVVHLRLAPLQNQYIELVEKQLQCELRRDSAHCCRQCLEGFHTALQAASKWRPELVITTMVSLNFALWCQQILQSCQVSSVTTQCCQETIKMINQSIKWCDLKPAPCFHKCHEPHPGSTQVQCSCYDGYRLADDGKTCVDIDECEELTHNCDPNYEICSNTIGKFQCLPHQSMKLKLPTESDSEHQCSSGYYFNHTHGRCKDIDECRQSLHNCKMSQELCRNLLGSFICIKVGQGCPSGFRKTTRTNTGTGCEDIDECAENSFDCDENLEDCENFIGSYTCEPKLNYTEVHTSTAKPSTTTVNTTPKDPTKCPQGYRFVRFSFQCEDINECRIGQHSCNLTYQNCVNLNGSYRCVNVTNSGAIYETESKINQTKTIDAHMCQTGFEFNERYEVCVDIDECHLPVSPCSTNAICQNTIGSYLCHCQAGFVKNGDRCDDIDECVEGLHQCFSLQCVNLPGSFDCIAFVPPDSNVSPYRQETLSLIESCPKDQLLIGGECRKLDCGYGFVFNDSTKKCEDLNECNILRSPCAPGERCTNTVGSYRCNRHCHSGYLTTQTGCEDIDECTLGTHYCGKDQVCKNRPGSYSCECPPGFELRKDRCEDIDECQYSELLACPDRHKQRCINTPGSFHCQCLEGFHASTGSNGELVCEDIDECPDSSVNRCEHQCQNYEGSHRCICDTGYKLADDGYSCVDIDECHELRANQSQSLCYYQCENVPGSFQCICPPGYESQSNGRICKDINECEDPSVCPGSREYCLNVRGTYRCNIIQCPRGYMFEHETKKCLRHLDGIFGHIDVSKPLFYSYSYLSIVSNIRLPRQVGYLDLVSMSGPVFSVTGIKFNLTLNSAKPGRDGVQTAMREDFILRRPLYNQIVVSLIRPISGPQDVELELTVSLYQGDKFGGSSKAFIFIIVSEYEF